MGRADRVARGVDAAVTRQARSGPARVSEASVTFQPEQSHVMTSRPEQVLPRQPLSEPLTFQLAGHPQGKGRARAFVRGGHIGHYTPAETRSYEGMIREAAFREMAGREPTGDPVSITMTAFFGVPKSFSKLKALRALAKDIVPAKRPDLDNIAKAFLDAMNGVVFRDDSQIVRCDFAKVYGTAPKVVVTVRPFGSAA